MKLFHSAAVVVDHKYIQADTVADPAADLYQYPAPGGTAPPGRDMMAQIILVIILAAAVVAAPK